MSAFPMLLHHLKIAFRALSRQKGYAFINLAGLAVGTAASLLIFLFVLHELSFDRFHANSERTFQLVLAESDGDRGTGVPTELPGQIDERFPQVEMAAHLTSVSVDIAVPGNEVDLIELQLARTQSGYFDVFSFEPVAGNLQTALREPASVVLTESATEQLFGDDNPIGKSLIARNHVRGEVRQMHMSQLGENRVGYQAFEWNDVTYTVTAVIKDVPSSSSIQFDIIASPQSEETLNWGQGFLVLREGASSRDLEEKLAGTQIGPFSDEVQLRLQPYLRGQRFPTLMRCSERGCRSQF